MEKVMNGVTVTFDNEGYLNEFSDWNKEVAQAMAEEENITLTDDHWKVLEYLRKQYEEGSSLSIRSIGKSGVVSIKEFYTLFPEGPLKKASRIAGIPKPKSCI